MPGIKGLATGAGSLPFTYRDIDTALDMIFRYVPNAPFWPQLPKADMREGMLAQFSQNLPCFKVCPDGLYFDPRNQEAELEVFYEQIISNNLDYFKIGPDFAAGLHEFYRRLKKWVPDNMDFIKCQITGPFTFAASLSEENGTALLHNPIFMQVIIKGLVMKALWQVKLFSEFGKKMILFIDEPYLACFGSAYTPLNRVDVVKGMNELAGGIKSQNVLIGVHCCGNTDWSLFTEVSSIDIINFDAWDFLDKFVLYAQDIKKFIERGGIICWGVVPTGDYSGELTPEDMSERINRGIDALVQKGVNKNKLQESLLVSPACGLGALDARKAEGILNLLAQTSNFIKKSS